MATGEPTGDLDIQIIGLAQNARYSEVKGEISPRFFRPYRQNDNIGSMNFYVRGSVDPAQLLSARQGGEG